MNILKLQFQLQLFFCTIVTSCTKKIAWLYDRLSVPEAGQARINYVHKKKVELI